MPLDITYETVKKQDRYQLVKQVTDDFWNRWVSEITPMHVVRQKWHETKRNLQPGDVVLVHGKSELKRGYTMAVVNDVKMSSDGLVRSCDVSYRIPNTKDKIAEYSGGKEIKLSRSVQKLTLLLGVEEQTGRMIVENGRLVEEAKV